MRAGEILSIIHSLDKGGDVETTRERLVAYEKQALPMMLECLPEMRTWRARNAVVYTAIKYARTSEHAKEIGRGGLADKSKRVRQTACALAAFSLDNTFLPELTALHRSSDAETALDARAAIQAIRHQNHHLFMDRHGTGRIKWNVMGSDVESD